MQEPKISLQSRHLLGDRCTHWHFLNPDEWESFQLPSHLADQVFRVAVTRTPSVCFFEVLVSEQYPKDATSYLAKSIVRFSGGNAVINVIHAKSPNAHLIFHDKRAQSEFLHLDVDFALLSRFDQMVIDKLQNLTPHHFHDLMALTRGKNLRNSFFRTLKGHLASLDVQRDSAHFALIDLLLKMVFLIFVQRKGWLNFDPFYLQSKMEFCHTRGLSILNCFFKPLFSNLDGRKTPSHVPLGELPQLGGGLFEFAPEYLPAITNDWILNLYRDLISQYSFSLFEAKTGRSVLGISPEILGHVFENLLLARHRKQHGIYYTPGEIAEKQVKASFQTYLRHHSLLETQPRRLAKAISSIRVLDPSCGSGTYLVAAFQILLQIQLSLSPRKERYNGALFQLKRKIVCENLFGMDIHPMAIRLSEVRLWLNMIQDLEVSRPAKAPSLPSLQHHLRHGDFLYMELPEDLVAAKSWSKLPRLESLRKRFPTTSSRNRIALLRHIRRLEHELENFLHQSADTKRNQAQCSQTSLFEEIPERTAKGTKWEALPNEPFRPHILFSREFLTGGFDLIIGNPPWVFGQKIDPKQKRRLNGCLPKRPKFPINRSMDLSVYFLLAATKLLNRGGHLSFLLPGKILQAKYAQPVREYLFQHFQLNYLFDFGLDQNLVFRADTFPLVLGLTRSKTNASPITIERHGKSVHQSFVLDRRSLRDQSGVWVLNPPSESGDREGAAKWPRLEHTRWKISRGITTNFKRGFVFKKRPDCIDPDHVRPLLLGRDIKPDSFCPSSWIYWPFEDGNRRILDLSKQNGLGPRGRGHSSTGLQGRKLDISRSHWAHGC